MYEKPLSGTKEIFMHMLDIVVLNSYNLWLVKTGNRVPLRIFEKKLINQILEKYGIVQATLPRQHSARDLPDHLHANPGP